MKKITFLLLTILHCMLGYSQFPENFEDPLVTVPNGFPAGWLVTDNGVGTTTNWTIQSNATVVISGTKSAYINRQEIGAGNTSEDWLVSPSTLIPTNGQLRFFTKQSLPGDNGTLYQIRISSGPTQAALGSYTVLKQWTELELNGTFNLAEEKVVDFVASSFGINTFIAFVRVYTQPTATQGGDRWIIDDINVVQRCPLPGNLDANAISATQANLFWGAALGAEGYQIEVLPASQTFTGSATDSNTTTSFVKTGLLPNTNYKYYVRSNCGNGSFSEWRGPFNFQTISIGTACADPIVIASLPYQTIDNTGNYGNTLAGPQLSSCIAGGTNYQSGNDVFYSYTATENCLVSFTLDPTQIRSSMFIYPSCAGLTGACLAGVGNTNSNDRVLNLNVTADTTYIIVISSNVQSPTIGYNLLIQCEGCLDKPTNPTVSGITTTGANFQWTAPATAVSGYQIAVQPQGSLVPSGPGQYSSTSASLELTTELAPATLYEYWVRSECSPGVFSAWVGPVLFNTQICTPSASQCIYTFRMTDSADNGWNGARMQIRQNGIVVATIGSTYTSGAGPVDASVSLCDIAGPLDFDIFWSVPGTQPQQCIVSVINTFGQTIATINGSSVTPGTSIYSGTVNCTVPLCNLAPTNVTLTNITTTGSTINWIAPGTENLGFDIFIVGAGALAPQPNTIPTYSGVNGIAGPFSFNIPVPNALTPDTAYDVYVRVQCNAPGNSPWSAVQTFTTLPTCPKPINQTVSAITTTSAVLGWTPGAGETQWEVLLLAAPNAIPPSAPAATPTVGANDFYIQAITGAPTVIQTLTQSLNSATIYYYYVRAICLGNDASTWTGPFIFNTITCEETQKCTYRFVLTNASSNNWNFARMEVRQNGIVVATLGIGGVNNSNGIPVPICDNVPFDLFWSVAGSLPQDIGLTIINTNNDIVFTKLPGEGTPLSILYTDTVLGNCAPPVCPKPTDLLVVSTGQTTANLSWTAGNTETQWEVYAVVQGGTEPENGTPLNTGVVGYYLSNNNSDFQITGLTPGTEYQYYVRAVCSTADISTWTILNPQSFITKPANDECSAAINVPVNPDRICADSVTGNTLGGTASIETSSCPGSENDDIWYSFVATNAFHIITLSDVVGTSFRYAAYNGIDCGTLTQIFCSPTNPITEILGNLIVGETYKIRVYTNGNNPTQSTAFTLCITTPEPITNDECATAIPAVVNAGLDCIQVTSGSVTGATASPQTSTCAGNEDDDVWFSFVATSPTHIINFQDIVGTATNLNSALYSGNECGSITFIACNNDNETLVNNLVPGTTYKIRVWSVSNQLEDIQFNLCIGSIVPPITVNTTQYTNQELVTDVLIQSTCATVSNITWSTGTTVATNGIGYFNRGESDFPFEDGIVLVTGSATSTVGPNTNILSGGGLGGDADLSAILAAQTPSLTGTLNNATKLEFDFVAIANQVDFEFMFASEEYGTFQCNFSDAFAFILTDITAGTPAINLAIIPGSVPPIPVSVVNIRDGQYNTSCFPPSVNVAYFGNYYNNPAGVLGAPINFNGITIPMVASSTVVPGHTYHIKMVIADYNDTVYDSAVFLKGNSFNFGNIELPDDYLIADGTALCLGDDVILDSGLDPALYDIQWSNGAVEIPGATNPTLIISESGIYFISAAYIGTDCETIESIVVEYFTDAIAGQPADLILCDAAGQGIFNLTSTKDFILAPFPIDTHTLDYFVTEADAIANNSSAALTQAEAEAYLGSNGQEIFVRVNLLTTSCFQIVSFNLIVQDLTPQFTLTGLMLLCPEESTIITVVPTNNSFDINAVSYEWTFDGTVISTATTNSLPIPAQVGYGSYTVAVNNGGCIAPQTFEIEPSNTLWTVSFGGTVALCPIQTGVLTALVTDNTANLPVTYTFTLPGGAEVVSTNNTLIISSIGVYTVVANILGCESLPVSFTVISSDANWEVSFLDGPYEICTAETVQLSFTASNFDIDDVNASYAWTSPSGTTGTGKTFVTNQLGNHTLSVNIFGCISVFNVQVAENDLVLDVDFTQGCENDAYRLVAEPFNASFDIATSTFLWTGPNVVPTNEPNAIILKANGAYTVTVTNAQGCSTSKTITVNNTSCEIQKGISPNNDGKNEFFDLSALNVTELSIYNRYGTDVYKFRNYTNQWSGQSNSGDELPDGTYFYVIKTLEGENITGWIFINR
jgi:gliding motility-associated-like protein